MQALQKLLSYTIASMSVVFAIAMFFCCSLLSTLWGTPFFFTGLQFVGVLSGVYFIALCALALCKIYLRLKGGNR